MNQSNKSRNESNIYFLVTNTKKREDYCSENMLRAYNKYLEMGMQPKWINKRDFNKMKFTRFDTIVVEKCEKISVNKITTANCCIINPEHLIYSTNATSGRKSPAYTIAMQNLCICASGLSLEDKRYIQALVVKMSGNFTTELDDKVTHLVTSSVLSVEYEKAIHMKIQIVKKEWVTAIWEVNKTDYIHAVDKRFDKYKVPMFYNLVVTATNIQRSQKEEVERLIKDNGGEYMGAFNCEEVNIVLSPEDGHLSQKLRHAREVNIICLTLNWLYESVKVGYALPFRNYIFQTVRERYYSRRLNARKTPSYSTTSSITYDKQQGNYIDQTAFKTSTMSNISTVSTVTTVLDRPTFNEAELAGPFLYGCIIYLAGFTSDQKDKLKRILDVGSAKQFNFVCDLLTHVIVGDEDSAANELKLLKFGVSGPYILRLEWLEESIKLKQPAPETNFIYGPSSSLIMNLQLLQERMSKEWKESSNFGQQDQQNATVSTTDEPHILDLTQMPGSIEENLMLPERNDSVIINKRLFKGLTFVVFGFNDMCNHVVKNIVAMNGRIVPGTFVNIPDYAIVPKCGIVPLKCIVKEIVTDLFIDDCIYHDRVVEIMYYHRPIYVTKHDVLSGCVVTFSIYVGVERSYLITLAKELGATYQDTFSRENIFKRNLYKNTHLICPIPEGRKYGAAVKWNIPTVTAEWLEACAAELTRVDETSFLVVKSLGPERPIERDISLLQTDQNQILLSTEPVASSSRSYNIIVPEAYFPNLETQNNNFGNMQLLNNEFSLPMNTTSETSEALCSQAYGPIPSLQTERFQMEGISYSSNLGEERPPLERSFSRHVSVLKKNWQEVNKKLPEDHNADEILPAAAKDGFN